MMENITVSEIVVNAKEGTTLHDTLLECIALSAKEDHTVTLHFNGDRYEIFPGELLRSVVKAA
jgi:hypothetical protein